jgi:hypothetical protein
MSFRNPCSSFVDMEGIVVHDQRAVSDGTLSLAPSSSWGPYREQPDRPMICSEADEATVFLPLSGRSSLLTRCIVFESDALSLASVASFTIFGSVRQIADATTNTLPVATLDNSATSLLSINRESSVLLTRGFDTGASSSRSNAHNISISNGRGSRLCLYCIMEVSGQTAMTANTEEVGDNPEVQPQPKALTSASRGGLSNAGKGALIALVLAAVLGGCFLTWWCWRRRRRMLYSPKPIHKKKGESFLALDDDGMPMFIANRTVLRQINYQRAKSIRFLSRLCRLIATVPRGVRDTSQVSAAPPCHRFRSHHPAWSRRVLRPLASLDLELRQERLPLARCCLLYHPRFE